MPGGPPFEVSPKALSAMAEIERLIGRTEGLGPLVPQPLLRKRNRVRTIRGSVGIEGNSLSDDQVTAILEGRRVVGRAREVREVTNANAAYEQAPAWRPDRERDLLAAHRLLMAGLLDRPGRYRATNVGVLHGTRVAHVAPPARRVPALVRSLLRWLRGTDTPPLIRSCVAHYELLFIHPFADGNGRVARLWQHVILLSSSPLFQIVPIESVIRARQRAYYGVLGRCDRAGSSTEFVEFALRALADALAETLLELRPRRPSPGSRLDAARDHFGTGWFRRIDYLKLHRTISTATASRDLGDGASTGALQTRGARRLTEYRFRSRR